jgi:prepilin-type processing-associated H-X9-DG protein
VELLVVVAVLSALAGLLTPALLAARRAARGTECLNNLRNMGLAAGVYTGSYGGFYVPAYRRRGLLNEAWDLTVEVDFGTSPPTRILTPGLLWGVDENVGSDSSAVQQCPAFDGSDMWAGETYTGYNYNTDYIGLGDSGPVHESRIRHPSATALFGDGEYGSGGATANKYMRAPLGDRPGADDAFHGRWAGTQGYRHNGRTNVLWTDGHGTAHAERHTRTEPGNGEKVGAGTGFLSPDDSLYDLE